MENILFKFIRKNELNFSINTKIPRFKEITIFLDQNELPYDTWTPKGDLKHNKVELSFTEDCNFQDVYIIAYLLKDYGLDIVYPSKRKENRLKIGTYISVLPNKKSFVLAKPMKLNDFLTIDPYLSSLFVIQNYFEPYYRKREPKNIPTIEFDANDEINTKEDPLYRRKKWNEDELEGANWDYSHDNPAHNPSENPWIDFFGPGEEAEQAYWNTD